jgi:hypothetical protein
VVFTSDVLNDFCRIKNKLIFLGDESDIESAIGELIRENDKVNWADVYDLYPTITAKVKDGKTISLSGTIRFMADIGYEDGTEVYESKGTFKLSGKGVPAP